MMTKMAPLLSYFMPEITRNAACSCLIKNYAKPLFSTLNVVYKTSKYMYNAIYEIHQYLSPS